MSRLVVGRRDTPESTASAQRSAAVDLQIEVQLRLLRAQGFDPADFEPRLIAGTVRLVRRLHSR